MFHAPSSTSNCLTFLETGVLPIDYEIHIRQLMFLYHILSLTNDDPVRLCYQEQKKYPAPSWANEVSALRSKYEIEESDEEIPDITKRQWKRIVKTKVRQYAFENLIKESETQKGSQNKYINLNKQSYLTELSPARARTIFWIRTGTIDLRTTRKYKYGDNTTCRLCETEDETVTHIVNSCPKIPRTLDVPDVYTTNCEQLHKVADRINAFLDLVKEKELESEDENT